MGYGHVMVNDENGNRLCTHPTDSHVQVGEDGWAQSIVTETESETWEWTADKDGRGHMVDFGPIDKPQDAVDQGGSAKYQEEGCYRRQGDERVPIGWSGWGETCGGRF
jgi:hypothetical protein